MALQFSDPVRNARLDTIETAVGTAPMLRVRTGAPPTNCAAADTGTVIATLSLPSDWMAAASGGTKAMLGTWQDLAADASGSAGHFRIYITAGTTAHIQGTVTATGGAGDMQVDNIIFVAGQPFTITSFVITEANA